MGKTISIRFKDDGSLKAITPGTNPKLVELAKGLEAENLERRQRAAEKRKEYEEYEAEVWEKYKIAPGQVYFDNDPRTFKGGAARRVRVLGVCHKKGRATCATIVYAPLKREPGRTVCKLGRTAYIQFERLSNKMLYTLIESAPDVETEAAQHSKE